MSENDAHDKSVILDKSDNSSGAVEFSRKAWISLLAQAPAEELLSRWDALALAPDFAFARRPEIGLVMTRGRAGATGEAFNLGEATVTRCSVRLASGEEGHAYALGRHLRKAEVSALCDALMQTERAPEIEQAVLRPLDALLRARRSDAARKAAATKVEFFTMTRGEAE